MAQAQEELAARQLPGTSECRELDVASFDSVREFSARACAEAAERGGRKVKLLVNNAGASPCSSSACHLHAAYQGSRSKNRVRAGAPSLHQLML